MPDLTNQRPLFTLYQPSGSLVHFYEHPLYGDEAPLVAVHPREGYQETDTEAYDYETARLYAGLGS